jgi:hypothetical protein
MGQLHSREAFTEKQGDGCVTTIDLDALESAPPEIQLTVLLRSIDRLRAAALEATQVWVTTAGRREEIRPLEQLESVDDAHEALGL